MTFERVRSVKKIASLKRHKIAKQVGPSHLVNGLDTYTLGLVFGLSRVKDYAMLEPGLAEANDPQGQREARSRGPGDLRARSLPNTVSANYCFLSLIYSPKKKDHVSVVRHFET